MKIVNYTKLLSCALSLFVLTATVHGGAPSLPQNPFEPKYLNPPKRNFCCFRYFPSSGDSVMQKILDYMPNSSAFILAVKDWKFLLDDQIITVNSLKEKLSSNSNATEEERIDAKNKLRQIYASATYLNSNTPFYINVTLENSADISTLLHLEAVCRVSGLTVCNIGTDDVQALAITLPILTKLQHFDLLGDEIGPDGKQITNIFDLNLMKNSFGSKGVIALAPSLALLINLRHLAIRECSIGPDGAIALAPVLELLTNLNYLDLSLNAIGTDGTIALVTSLSVLTKLEYLNLVYWRNRLRTSSGSA